MSTVMPIAPGLEYGVYSYAEAARLLGITPQRLARWADGYFYARREGQGYSAPVLRAPQHRKGVLTFPELMELFFCTRVRCAGRLATACAQNG